MQTRRQFFASATGLAGYLSLGTLELGADPLGLPIGFQVFPVREMLVRISKALFGSLPQWDIGP